MKPSIDIPSEKYTFKENEFMHEYNEQNNQNIVNNNNQFNNGLANNGPNS